MHRLLSLPHRLFHILIISSSSANPKCSDFIDSECPNDVTVYEKLVIE